ncbi:MAG: hypothetical protein HETSPECPRED_000157 [Heterodermia speciosa]|uniref:Uncharacterized protein n=1 Tax=Heterodermia speciosa TaxID=116794 RepID=A0A8H3ECP2_9LECA|nr:MAG: hypothetical protein HETSPECPRED_000157 [Heterodermia speciosa]
MTISAIPKEFPPTLAPPVNVAAVGCATDGAVALDTGETPVPVPAEGNAGRSGIIADEDNVTVKADVGEELSTSADVMVDVAVVEDVEEVDEGIEVSVDAGRMVTVAVFEEVEEVEEGTVVSVDPGVTVAVAVVVPCSSVAGISMVPVLMIKILVWQSKA